MKNRCKTITGFVLLFTVMFSTVSAENEDNNSKADTIRETSYRAMVPYDVYVTYNKTTHFIFPSAI